MENTNQVAREHLAQQRHHDDNRHEAMLERTEAELHQDATSDLDERARRAIAEQRQHTEHTKANMLARSEDEID